MFHKILGIVQIIFTLVFISFSFGWTDAGLATIAGIYFVLKGLLFTFIRTPISFLDAIAGSFILLATLGIFSNIFVSIIVILFLLQKGVTYLVR